LLQLQIGAGNIIAKALFQAMMLYYKLLEEQSSTNKYGRVK